MIMTGFTHLLAAPCPGLRHLDHRRRSVRMPPKQRNRMAKQIPRTCLYRLIKLTVTVNGEAVVEHLPGLAPCRHHKDAGSETQITQSGRIKQFDLSDVRQGDQAAFLQPRQSA